MKRIKLDQKKLQKHKDRLVLLKRRLSYITPSFFSRWWTIVLVPLLKKHNKLIKRRGGIIEHIRLTTLFNEIGNDPYIRKTRDSL